jgi:predicted RNase H-like HicB family nuclease
MTRTYEIILIPDDSDGKPGYAVYAPDFDIWTQGRSYSEALYMARDAIYQVGVSLIENGQEAPEPGTAARYESESGQITEAVTVSFEGARVPAHRAAR